MRAVVQRSGPARVTIKGGLVGEIASGVVVLVGISAEDGAAQARWLADKVCNLRIFPDDDGKMNRSLLDTGGEALIVSQFTLYGDARKGRRPSFVHAALGPETSDIYDLTVDAFKDLGVRTATGTFRAMMDVTLTNEGPVTILLDSDKVF